MKTDIERVRETLYKIEGISLDVIMQGIVETRPAALREWIEKEGWVPSTIF
jgi:hypothetical protein